MKLKSARPDNWKQCQVKYAIKTVESRLELWTGFHKTARQKEMHFLMEMTLRFGFVAHTGMFIDVCFMIFHHTSLHIYIYMYNIWYVYRWYIYYILCIYIYIHKHILHTYVSLITWHHDSRNFPATSAAGDRRPHGDVERSAVQQGRIQQRPLGANIEGHLGFFYKGDIWKGFN